MLITKLFHFRLTIVACLTCFYLASCREKIDDSDYYTFTGEMMTDRLRNDPNFSLFYTLTTRVKLSDKSASTVSDLLSARGNYTCFAPTNMAIQNHLDSLYGVSGYDIGLTPDSTANDIVRSCIIECDRDKAYHSVDFVEGAISRTNMNDRYLTVSFDVQDDMSVILINTWSMIVQKDVEVENGYIHAVNRVLSPTRALLPDLLSGVANMTIFSQLLEVTGWEREMRLYRDEAYEEDHPLQLPGVSSEGQEFAPCPEHRYFGYTAFVEPDQIYREYGITDVESLMEFLKKPTTRNGEFITMNWDEATTFDTDYMNENNAVNQFVAYHIMPQRIAYDKLTINYNEYGYVRGTGTLGINVFEYYRMMGKHNRLLKITKGQNTAGNRINRYALMDKISNKENNVIREGISIKSTNEHYDFNSMNGFYYPIDDLLLYDEDVPNKVLNERIRFDATSCVSEIHTIGLKRIMSSGYNTAFPQGFFDNLTFTNDTHVNYLPGYNMESSWCSYQCDEFNIVGQYDFTVKILPVPYSGTYELRIGNSANPLRGMAQVYLGTDKDNLPALGIPLDLRVEGVGTYVNWLADTGNDEVDEENESMMKIHDFMKAPKSYVVGNMQARSYSRSLRKVIYRGHFDHTKTYYLRFKSVLESTNSQFFFDYLELVPKSVYNGVESEDRW